MDQNVLYVCFALGMLIVYIHSVNYFNQPNYAFVDSAAAWSDKVDSELLEPALPQFLTDRAQFNFYRVAYVLVAEFAFVLMALLIPDLGKVVSGKPVSSETAAVLTLDNILLSTLIIAGIAPNFPWVRDWLEKSKLYLHKKAQIPQKGQSIFRRLRSERPIYRDVVKTRLVGRQPNADRASGVPDLQIEDFGVAPDSLEGRWAKLSYLLYFVEEWSHQAPFCNYINHSELRYGSVLDCYDHLRIEFRTYRASGASQSEQFALSSRLDMTLNRTYRLISCLLYLAAGSEEGVDRRLDEMGYRAAEHNEYPIPWKLLVFVLFAVVFAVLLGAPLSLLLFGYMGIEDTGIAASVERVGSWVGYGTPFVVAPVALVLFIKRYLTIRGRSWPLMSEHDRYTRLVDRPWHIYFAVAFVSYVFAATLLLFLILANKVAQNDSFVLESTLRVVMTWSLVVFLINGCVAFRIDSVPAPHRHWLGRWSGVLLSTLGQGVAIAAIVYFVHAYTRKYPLDFLFHRLEQTQEAQVLLVTGFLLGVFMNLALEVGRVRQRRCGKRRTMRREVALKAGGIGVRAETLNVSESGALVEVRGDRDDVASVKDAATVEVISLGEPDVDDARAPAAAKARIVRQHGDRLHLAFDDHDDWLNLRELLDRPVCVAG